MGLAESRGREMARQLLGRAIGNATEPATIASAVHRVCAGVSAHLRPALGDDGYNAVLARALARTEAAHPALERMRDAENDDIHLDAVVASVQAHGIPATIAAVESMLAMLIDILSGLIGGDIVQNLLENGDPPLSAPNDRQAP